MDDNKAEKLIDVLRDINRNIEKISETLKHIDKRNDEHEREEHH